MDQTEALNRAKQILREEEDDRESLHIKLDNLLCDVLNELGYGALVKLFRETHKWYS